VTQDEIKKKLEDLEQSKAQNLANLNFLMGMIKAYQEMLDPPKEADVKPPTEGVK